MDPPSKGVHIARVPSSESSTTVDIPQTGSFSSFSDSWKASKGEDTFIVGVYHLSSCPICFERFSLENPAVVVACGHGFHLHCLEDWRQRSPVCPVCMKPMQGDGVPMMAARDTRRRRRFKSDGRKRLCPSDSPQANEGAAVEAHASEAELRNAEASCATALGDEHFVDTQRQWSILGAIRAISQWCSRGA